MKKNRIRDKKFNRLIYSLIFIVVIFLVSRIVFAEELIKAKYIPTEISPSYVPGEVIVKFKDSSLGLNKIKNNDKQKVVAFKEEALVLDAQTLANEEAIDLEDISSFGNIALFKTLNGESLEDLILRLKNNPNVEYVEPNYYRIPATINTNDEWKNNLWGLDNTGQSVNGTVGTIDADADAPEAWAINEGITAPIIAAIVDSGVAYNHPDLVNNMWDGTNCKDENGIFLGGCIHGYNFYDNTKLPLPSGNAHGTHIAGTIGATKGNNMGVIGMAPNVKIMAFNTNFNIYDIVKAIDFATQNGAKVINASYGGDQSIIEKEAIERFTTSGGLFIAAAHNYARSNDVYPIYPASDNIDAIISVAATDQSDNLASFSNWGPTSVDIAAPGVNIYSTYCSTDCSGQSYEYMYGYMNGTSMATPQVVGLASLIWGTNPSLTNIGVKNIILSTGDSISSLNTKLLTGKRINAYNAEVALSSLSSYVPVGGYVTDNIIPASQINYANDTGIITLNFKVKDTYPNLTEELSDFSYSTDNGTTWQSPINGDNSSSLSDNWSGNNYISSIDYLGNTYSFTFDSRNIESTGINNATTSNTKIRFKVNDGINTSGYIVSEAFEVNNYFFNLNIFQPTSPVSINADTFNIIGSTSAGSLVQVYRDVTLVGSLQLGSTDTEFDISVALDQNTVNNFTVKATEPVYSTEKTVSLSGITESDNSPYLLGWIEQTGSGLHRWRSISSSFDGKKLIAADGDIGNPYRTTYLYTSNNGGFTWVQRLGVGGYNWASVASSSDGAKLVAVAGGDYDLGYIKTSTDSGTTWVSRTALGSLRWQSVASSSDGTKLSAVTGGRYENGYIYTSNDSGVTWTKQNGAGLHYWMSIDSSSDGINLVAVSGGPFHTGYIYTSSNSGETWIEQTGSDLRSWQAVSSSSDGIKLVAATNGYVYSSIDGGVTWTQKTDLGSNNWCAVSSSSDGSKIVVVSGCNNSGYIYISNDSGNNWTQQSSVGSKYWASVASSSDGIKLIAGTNSDSYVYTYNNILIPPTSPTLTTSSASSLTTTTATLNGNITATGGVSPTTRGFNYGLDTSYGTNVNENGTFSTGVYTANITSLTCGTTYHYQSYATNTIGTSYGNDQTFTTSACPTPGGGGNSSGGGSYIPKEITQIIIPVINPIIPIDEGCLSGYLFSVKTGVKCPIPTNIINSISTIVAPETVPIITRILKQGMIGLDVKQLQIYLNTHGYKVSITGAGSLGKETFSFGLKTKQAVILFQKANKLIVDGIVGKGTKSKMK